MSNKFIVFHVEGGLGKNIAGTAVIKAIKEAHKDRKIIVTASWPEVYLNNPNIERVYRAGNTSYFYDNYIKDKDTIVYRKEPYFENDHIMRKTPLMVTWFNMYGLKYDSKKHQPYLPMNMIQSGNITRWKRNKPTMLLHTNGGPFNKDSQPHSYAWTRDMPIHTAQNIVQEYKKDYHIFQLCRENSTQIPGTEVVNKPMTNYDLFSLLCSVKKRVLIDSCLQHAAAAYNLSSTVLWVGTSPDMFGYDLHDNISAREPSNIVKNVDAYLFDYDFNGIPHQCPYPDKTKIFDLEEIYESIDETVD